MAVCLGEVDERRSPSWDDPKRGFQSIGDKRHARMLVLF
jgi:hypothetical protein